MSEPAQDDETAAAMSHPAGSAAADQTEATPRPPGDRLPVVVKKYANRRLYNTESSSYITLDTLADMVRDGRDFVVYDAKSGEDITRGVLTQIILEEESKGRAMLPTGFLRQLIGFYGNSMQAIVPRYLEQAMATFARQQEQMRRAMQQTLGPFLPFTGIEEVGRQNMAMMERAMSLFSPFYRDAETTEGRAGGAPAVDQADQHGQTAALLAEVESLQRQLANLQAELAIAQAAPAPIPAREPSRPGTNGARLPAAEPPVSPSRKQPGGARNEA